MSRAVSESRGRRALYRRSDGLCEVCQCRASEAHHRKNRSQGGTWAVENLLHLCHDHHRLITEHPEMSREFGWSVRSTDDPAAVAVRLYRHGWVHLTPDGTTRPAERKAA